MSIDMKSYAGDIPDPAAVDQQNISQGQQVDEEFRMPEIPSEPSIAAVEPPVIPEAPKEDPQERNFRALQESVEQLKAKQEAERQEYQLQLRMLQANSVQQDQPKQRRMFEGMEDGDIPNVGEVRRAWNEREAEYNGRIEELQVANQFPDYAEVLNKYGKQLAQTDPLYVQGIRGADNKSLFAYQYAKREQRFQELEAASKAPAAPSQASVNAQRIVENSRKPGTLSSSGGQGTLSKADYFETMSDAEFMKMASKNLEAI